MDTILKDTYTLSLLKHRLSALKLYLEQQFFNGASKDLPEVDLAWIKNLPESFLKQFNKDNLSQMFVDFEAQANQLPALTIYLTFDADEQTIALIGQKVRQTFPQILIIDTKYDPKLIAGCSLVWKGLLKDYSLRSKIDQRKEEILRSFQAFLR